MQRLQALRRTNRVAAWLERNRQAAGDWDGSDGDSASRSARLAQLLAALAGDGLDVEAASQRLDDLAWLMGRLQQVPGSRESLAAALAEASALRPDPDGPSRPPPPPGAVAAASPSTFRDSGAGGGSAGEAAEEPQRSLSTRKLAVTHRGLERARSTMQDFVQSYFMFHGLDPANPADVFRYLPGAVTRGSPAAPLFLWRRGVCRRRLRARTQTFSSSRGEYMTSMRRTKMRWRQSWWGRRNENRRQGRAGGATWEAAAAPDRDPSTACASSSEVGAGAW